MNQTNTTNSDQRPDSSHARPVVTLASTPSTIHVGGEPRLSTPAEPTVEEIERTLPLSPMQRDLAMETLLRPASLTNNLGYAVRIHHALNIDHWRQAIQKVSDSQSILRAVFLMSRARNDLADNIFLGIRKPFPVHLQVEDYSSQPLDEKSLQKRIHTTIYTPYQFIGGELIRYVLIKQSENLYVTILATHHILMDGVGFAAQLDAVCRQYEHLEGLGEPIPLPQDLYPDYLHNAMLEFDAPPTLDFWQRNSVPSIPCSLPSAMPRSRKTPVDLSHAPTG